MDIEDRIRYALKHDAQDIHVSPDVRKRIMERLEQQRGSRKWLVGTGVAGILFLGANSLVSAATGKSLFDIVVHTTTISQGEGMISDFGLVPSDTNANSETTSEPLSQDTGSQPTTSTGKPSGLTPNAPAAVQAHVQKMPSINGNHFADNRYGKALSDFLGTDQFPKLTMNNVQVHMVQAVLMDKGQQKFQLDAWGFIPVGTKKEELNLTLYHNQEGTVQFTGQTTPAGENNVKTTVQINGQNATCVTFTNGNAVQRYITWHRGSWGIVLYGGNVPEAMLLQIAQNVDEQAQTNN